MKTILHDIYSEIVSVDNLLSAWKEFKVRKSKKPDVQKFEMRLMDNILALHRDLLQGEYKHGGYIEFVINDPKQRMIHKACVRDRLLHHAIFRILYPYFNRTFIADSFSSRKGKGTHRAVKWFRRYANKVSKNNTKTCWVLKCDIKGFFASIDHKILQQILRRYINDKKAIQLFKEIIESYCSGKGIGLPLGNLTSQLFVNIYLNELDQFVKHVLRVKYYIRYCDDFVIFGRDQENLIKIKEEISGFLGRDLKLTLHKDKVSIRKLHQGVDFLGYVTLSYHRVLRTKTKKRVLNRVTKKNLPSYLGVLKHCNGYKLGRRIEEIINEQVSE